MGEQPSQRTIPSIVEEPTIDGAAVYLDLLVDDVTVRVCFPDRSSDGAAKGAPTPVMRKALRKAREYRRAHRGQFESLFDELERRCG